MNPPKRPLLAEDLNELIAFAAFDASATISDQRSEFISDQGSMKIKDPSDSALRFAVDDFLVGYAVGRATRFVQTNGRDIKEIHMNALLTELQKKLGTDYPGLDVERVYRINSAPVSCGILFGLREPGRNGNYSALKKVWGLMNAYQMAPGAFLNKFAYENFGISGEEGCLVQSAGDEMHARYVESFS
jgi:hypothetical protein